MIAEKLSLMHELQEASLPIVVERLREAGIQTDYRELRLYQKQLFSHFSCLTFYPLNWVISWYNEAERLLFWSYNQRLKRLREQSIAPTPEDIPREPSRIKALMELNEAQFQQEIERIIAKGYRFFLSRPSIPA